MKNISFKYLWCILCVFLCSNFLQVHAQDVEVGTSAPEITLPNPNGINNTLSALRGKVVMLYFWVSWDPNSRTANKDLQSFYNKYSQAKFKQGSGFDLFTISLDYESKEWTDALRSDRLPGAYHTNDFYSKYAGVYGINKLPAIFLIDAQGFVQMKDITLQQANEWLQTQILAPEPQAIESNPVETEPIDALRPVYGGATIPSTDNIETDRTETQEISNTTTSAINKNTPERTSAQTALVASKSYRIQVGAYKTITPSQTKELSDYGQVTTESVGTLKRLLVGNFKQLSDAVMLLKDLQTKTIYHDAVIIEYVNDKRSRSLTKADLDKASTEEPTYKNTPAKKATTNKNTATMKGSNGGERKAFNNANANVQWTAEFDPTSTKKTTNTPNTTNTKTPPKTNSKTTTANDDEAVVVDAGKIEVFKRMETDGFVENMSNRSYSTAKNSISKNSKSNALKLPSQNKNTTPALQPATATEEKMSNTSNSTTSGGTYYDDSGLFNWYDQPNVTTQKTSDTMLDWYDPATIPTQRIENGTIVVPQRTSTTNTNMTTNQSDFSNQPTFYDYSDQYISKTYTKSSSDWTPVTPTTTTLPTPFSVKAHTANTSNPATTKSSATTTVTTPPTTTTTTTTTHTPIAPPVSTEKAVELPTSAPTPAAPVPASKVESTDLDNYLDNYDFSQTSSKKKKISKKSKNK